jgi:hypothetical protein
MLMCRINCLDHLACIILLFPNSQWARRNIQVDISRFTRRVQDKFLKLGETACIFLRTHHSISSSHLIIRHITGVSGSGHLMQWYSTSFIRVPPNIISLQLCTPKVVGVYFKLYIVYNIHLKWGEKNSVALVRKRTVPTERPPLVSEIVPTFADRGCCVVSTTDPPPRSLVSVFLTGAATISSK